MKNHTDLTDKEFLEAFSICALPPSLFNHQAHIRLAWILVTKNGSDAARKEIVKLIHSYVKHQDQEDKFNLTLTVAATEIIASHAKRSGSRCFSEFISEFPELISDFKTKIHRHYSFNIFNSENAKTQYLPPDLIPFD